MEPRTGNLLRKFSIHQGDLPTEAVAIARQARIVSWDLETSGLNWRAERIGLCQIFVPGAKGFIVRVTDGTCSNLMAILENPQICKIFHHAVFDLRFMMHHWQARPTNIACTKISSKICSPERDDHGLKDLLAREFGIRIDKSLRKSNWVATSLTSEQLLYAAADVYYLAGLFSRLRTKLAAANRWELADASFRYLPVRAALDLLGPGDVFQY